MIAAQASLVGVPFRDDDSAGDEYAGMALYCQLMEHDQAEADVSDDDEFDRHVLASILAVASMEDGPIGERTGLIEQDINEILVRFFPKARIRFFSWMPRSDRTDDEVVMVRDLLLAQRSTEGEIGCWLAAMIGRRATEPNHLWEDLGLRERAELSRLLARHFAPLSARNSRNMRWKRFFYRMLCEDDGFVMCTTPVCTECNDFDLCFGEENGESRMAKRRRDFLRGVENRPAAGSARL